MTTHFRRGQSKVYYASEVWDPGEDEEFARTSFRSGSGSEHSETLESYCNNDDFVASLMRRTSVEKSMYRYVKIGRTHIYNVFHVSFTFRVPILDI